MKAIMSRKKMLAITALLMLVGSAMAHAHVVRRIENHPAAIHMCDSVTSPKSLCAKLTMGDPTTGALIDFAELNIYDARVRSYNARLSVRCSIGHHIQWAPLGIAGPRSKQIHCQVNDSFPLRIEGAIDEI